MAPDVRGVGSMRLAVSLLALSWILAAPAASVAQDAKPLKVGEATFTPPAGWKAVQQPDGVVKTVSPEENAIILVMPGEKFPGDLTEGFRVTWDGVRQMMNVRKVVSGGGPESGKTDAGYESVATRATVQDARGNELVCHYTLLRNGDAVLGIAYFAAGQKWFDQYKDAYEKSLAGLTLGSAVAKPQAAEGRPMDKTSAEPRPQPSPAPAPSPAKRNARPAPKPPEPKPGVVAGVITDANGNAIDVPGGAKLSVSVHGTTFGSGQRNNYSIVPEPDGRYASEVPDGLYAVWGWIETEYNGNHYKLRLHSELDKEPFHSHNSKPGIVANFRWKLQGLKPGGDRRSPIGSYGQSVIVRDAEEFNRDRTFAVRYPGAKIVVRLAPRGPLIDGSTGKEVPLELTTNDFGGQVTFWDIPLGKYQASATLTTADGKQRPLNVSVIQMGSGQDGTPPARSAEFQFEQPSEHEDVRTVAIMLSE